MLVKGWIRKGDKFLLAQRGKGDAHQAGAWSLPGGNVESEIEIGILEKTLQREIKEEVGIEVGDAMRLIYNNSFMREADNSHVVNLTFLCDWKSGEPKPLEDTAEVNWFTLEELRNFKNPPDYLEKEIKQLVSFLSNK